MGENDQGKRIGYFLERTTRIVKLTYIKEFKKEGIDITPEQWVILDNLYKQNGQSQKELANESFKNAPTISRILDLLVNKGLLTRQASNKDRRVFKIFLTDQGISVVERALPIVQKLRTKGWHELSHNDYEQFRRIINQVFKNYNRTDET